MVIAVLLSNLVIWLFVPKRFKTENFLCKKSYYTMAGSVILFAVVVMRLFMSHNFILMASKLLVEFACLVGAVLMSLLIRAKGSQIKSCFVVYSPILLMGFLIIMFRIIFITNNLVEVLFPPVLLLFTIWQWFVMRRHKAKIPASDTSYTLISFAVMIVSCAASWYGYSLLSVQIFIWWIFQLTAIQAITCVNDMTKKYEIRYLMSKIRKHEKGIGTKAAGALALDIISPSKKTKGNHIEITWMYDLFNKTLVPLFIVLSILFCVYLAAGIFDLTESCKVVFYKNFINIPDVCELSLWKMLIVSVLLFIFRFVSYVSKALYKKYRLSHDTGNGDANITLANNLISIVVWGAFFIFVLILLHVPKSGISIVTAGLATGVGFAMKDVLENFFYGMSLMTGRIRVGDFIECDGIRGKVDSITYQSTQVITSDGCIIAFLNSSLFNKNFKNLTRNHGYELVKLPIGVAYGANINEVRSLLVDALAALEKPNKEGISQVDSAKGISVILDEFGDNSVNLYVIFWTLVEDKLRICGEAKEIIYNTLTKNEIDIPFPQRTVYIKEFPQK
ncbi:MAG: mechanosensitive ion channel domain-containing protein [Paludibacteraceae bacterium]